MPPCRSVSVVGLGKLGAPMAACFASHGYRVIGVDVREEVVRAVRDGTPPVFEPGLAELMKQSHACLSATGDLKQAVLDSEMTFIIVPTPSLPDGGFDLKHVLATLELVGQALSEKKSEHLVVLCSTVLPGASDSELIPALERHAHKRCGGGFDFCYSPEFVALGDVIRNLQQPDFVLVGAQSTPAADKLLRFYRTVHTNEPPAASMTIVNAELTKIAVNTFVTTRISFANTLAALCERLPGGDVDSVTAALGLDPRIGPKYLRGAIGYGGPCFPRDNLAFSHLAHVLGVSPAIADATHHVNLAQAERLLANVLVHVSDSKDAKVAVLGLSYKPDTDVVEHAAGIGLAQGLVARGIEVACYDPAAVPNARALVPRATFADSVAACVREADVIVVTTAWNEFRSELDPADLATRRGALPVLIDCWRLLDRKRYADVARYVALGCRPQVDDRRATPGERLDRRRARGT